MENIDIQLTRLDINAGDIIQVKMPSVSYEQHQAIAESLSKIAKEKQCTFVFTQKDVEFKNQRYAAANYELAELMLKYAKETWFPWPDVNAKLNEIKKLNDN